MKRSSPHASGVFGLWRRLGLGFVVRDIGIFSGSVGEPGNRCPLSLPTSRRCPSPFREYDVDSHPRPAIRPLWAFPAATRMEPGSANGHSGAPGDRCGPRLGPMLPLSPSCPHRKLVCILVSGAAVRGECHEGLGTGIKFFTQRFQLHPRHPRALLPSRIALRAFAPQIAPPERFAYGRHSLPGSSPRMTRGGKESCDKTYPRPVSSP